MYLTEQKLVDFLKLYIDKEGISNRNFLSYKFRPDFVSHKEKLVVEFDGYLHYTKAETIVNDYHKDAIIQNSGYSVIRIPYFVQLDKLVMQNAFFDYILEPFDLVNYPHGFVDSKAVLPADFCSLGVERFRKDLIRFAYIADDILESLKKIKKSEDTIYPLDWRH